MKDLKYRLIDVWSGVEQCVIAWPFCFLLKNRFFGPCTAKSQPIWIKFCTDLLLYGIHL